MEVNWTKKIIRNQDGEIISVRMECPPYSITKMEVDIGTMYSAYKEIQKGRDTTSRLLGVRMVLTGKEGSWEDVAKLCEHDSIVDRARK